MNNNIDIKAMLKNAGFEKYRVRNRRLQVIYSAVDEEDRQLAKLCSFDATYFVTYKQFLEFVECTINTIDAGIYTMYELIPDVVTCTDREVTIIVLIKRIN